MTRKKTNSIRVFVPALLMLVTAGCAAPPNAELEAARQALSAAETAEADVYSEAQYVAAAQLLAEAESEMAAQEAAAFSRDYSAAVDLLTRAKAEAEAAAAAAPENKEQIRLEAEALLDEAQQAVQAITVAIDSMRPGSRNQVIIDGLRTELSVLQAALDAAAESVAGGQYIEALDQIQGVRDHAAVVQEKIQTSGRT